MRQTRVRDLRVIEIQHFQSGQDAQVREARIGDGGGAKPQRVQLQALERGKVRVGDLTAVKVEFFQLFKSQQFLQVLADGGRVVDAQSLQVRQRLELWDA